MMDDVIAFAGSSREADKEVEIEDIPVIAAAELNGRGGGKGRGKVIGRGRGRGRGRGKGREEESARVGTSVCMSMDAISKGCEEMTYASPAMAPASSTPLAALPRPSAST